MFGQRRNIGGGHMLAEKVNLLASQNALCVLT
jgi:hypothetical protein